MTDPTKKTRKKTGRTASGNPRAGQASAASETEDEVELNPENPRALYEDPDFDGPPASAWQTFQRWSHRHKRGIYAFFFAAIIMSFIVVMRTGDPADPRDAIRTYFGRFAGETDDWQYNIERYYIGKLHLNSLYPVLVRLTYGDAGARPMLNDRDVYRNFVREQYEMDLLVYAALQSNVLQDADARLFIENALRQAAADYYLYKQVGTDQTDFRVDVSDAEAEAYYNRNRETYEKSGLDRPTALGVIKNTLAGLRRDQIRQQLAVQRAQIVADLKDRIGPRLNQE